MPTIAPIPLVVAVLIAAGGLSASADQPNIVIILTDDQGTLDAGCYGATDLDTPHIDDLARSGVRFTQAYSHIVCCPARAMLLTGRYPQRANVNTWVQGRFEPDSHNMFASEVTLAEILKVAGYRTALFGKWHLGSSPGCGPTTQGFDEFFGIRAGFIDNYNHFHLHDSGYHTLFEGETEVFRRGEYFPEMITERSIVFMEENRDRPFFLYYAMNIPHYPEQSLGQFAARYAELPEPRRSYATIVSTTDHYIGRILATLDRIGVRDNTIVVFTSDNGYSAEDYQIKVDNHASGLPKGHNYGANGGGGYTGKWLGSKGSLLEGGIRVPTIVRYPGRFPQGETRDQLVTAMDWLPTILDICGFQPPDVTLDGHSLTSVIEDNAPTPYGVVHWQWQDAWSVRDGDWKLIGGKNRNYGVKQNALIAKYGKLGTPHLANLADEMPELKNHANEHPEIVVRLTKLHDAWVREVMPE